MKPYVTNDEAVVRQIQDDPAFAAEYLRAALDGNEEPEVMLLALRHLAQARGIAKVAKKAGIERESLYRVLSPKGNPRLTTLIAVIRALGLSLSIQAPT